MTAAGILIALLSPFAAHLPWSLGVWPRVEPTIILLHCGAVLCAIGLGTAAARTPSRALASIRHPIVLIALAIAAWSIAVSPMARYPLLSIVGSPQLADGALLWLDTAVFIAGVRFVRQSARITEILGLATLAAAVVLPGLAAFPASRAIWFTDYLAFLGIAAAVAVPVALAHRFPKTRARIVLAMVAGLPAIAVSQNYTAILVLLALSGPAGALVYLTLRPGNAVRTGAVRRLAAAFTAAVACAAPFCISWLGSLGFMQSIRSRALINDVFYNFIERNPAVLLHGKGWGHSQQYFGESLATSSAILWDRSWDAVWRDTFHSHNLVLEALLSAGLPGAVGVVVYSAVLPLVCRKEHLHVATAYAIGYVCIVSFWFQMPGTIPVSVLAVALLTGPARPEMAGRLFPAITVVSLGAIASAQIGAAVLLADFSWRSFRFDRTMPYQAAHDARDTERRDCDLFPSDAWRGDSGLTLQFLRSYDLIVAPPAARNLQPSDIDRLDHLTCAATIRGARNGSRGLLRAGLLFRSQLAFNEKFAPYRERFAGYLEDWEEQVAIFLPLEPERSDLLYPYLSWSLARNQYSTIFALTDTVLARDPENAIALWFKGLALHQQGNPENRIKSLLLLDSGLKNGIEKWFRIPPEIKSRILSEAASVRRR